MRRLPFIAAVLLFVIPALGWADTPAVAGSSVPVTAISTQTVSVSTSVIASTRTAPVVWVATPTLVDAGETVSTPTPHAMTQPADGSPFVTLSRSFMSSKNLPSNTAMIFPDQERAYDVLNAGDLLSHQAGLSLLPKGAPSYPTTVNVRGAPASQTLVLLDGRPMEGVALGPADLSEIPVEEIDHIEVVRGGLSALYGPNALGGVINVITKRATYSGYPISHVSYEGASYSRQTYKLDYGSRSGPVDYFFFGDQQWQSGFRSNTDNSQYNIGGNAGLSMGKAGKLLFDASSYHNNSGIPGFRCDDTVDGICLNNTTPLAPNQFNDKDEKPASTPYARQINDANYLRAAYLVNLSTNVFLATRLYGQQREIEVDNASDPNPANVAYTDRREHSKGGEAQLTLPLGFLVGGTYTHDEENVADYLTPTNSFNAWVDDWGFFAQQTIRWQAFTLIPSGRYDKNSQFGESKNPRVQALVDATEWLNLSASAGRSFRAPTIDEVQPIPAQNSLGNPNLRPETAWTYDAGFDVHASSRSARVNFFLANIQDSIQTLVPQNPSDPASPLVSVNLDHSRRQGAEIVLSHVVSRLFREELNYTYLENVGIPVGGDHLVPLAYSPRHTANLIATFNPSPRWTLSPVARYEDSRYSGNDQTGTKMGSQVIVDLRLGYDWRQAEVFLGINDLADKRYEEQPGYPLPGRTVYFGVKLRLWG